MELLVSCSRCKRALLLVRGIGRTELARLQDHLAECSPDDGFPLVRVEDALRAFRVVAIDTEDRAERTPERGPQPSATAERRPNSTRRVA